MGLERPRIYPVTIHHIRQEVQLRQSRDIRTVVPNNDPIYAYVLGHPDISIPNKSVLTFTCIVPMITSNFIPKSIQVKLEGT